MANISPQSIRMAREFMARFSREQALQFLTTHFPNAKSPMLIGRIRNSEAVRKMWPHVPFIEIRLAKMIGFMDRPFRDALGDVDGQPEDDRDDNYRLPYAE